ncbi:SDR family oxidoreductase [Cryptosporangium phraense]|uniref:SDR family oxidoreductase n=1 Tax=Cryptosporangium phraense TaxID=2593070 RepID=A0A545AST7_9ACTN|nr:SDR family oxidoreductase [Cryptosporangium phraense]TQS43685.1 SDR family oxidoreductase [Cryptosporangium phraense]
MRTALVGGGASGIGRATAEELLRAGLRVTLFGRDELRLKTAADELGAAYVAGDLADPVCTPLADAARRADVVVLNAGGPKPGRVLDVQDPDWARGTELLLLGPLRLARAALPAMADRGFGRLVVVTSTAVRRPEPDLAVSVVLRSAMTAAAKLLAAEYAEYGVTVNCVAPGATDTARRREVLIARARSSRSSEADLIAAEVDTIPAGRAADPAEIAAAIGFLASEAAGYINGTVLTVDGGRTEAIW